MELQRLADDLEQEHASLDAVVAGIEPARWSSATPSPGWDVADQIGHLAYFDHTAAVAITDPQRFSALRDELIEATLGAPGAADELTLGAARRMTPDELSEYWLGGRRQLLAAARTLGEDARVPWYGPSMGARSFLTARLMETWAHGQDVADAVGVQREPTDRLVHVAQMGVITRSWSYLNRGEEPPDTPVSVHLLAPSGAEHQWGPPDAEQSVSGSMEGFCLVVTQRRRIEDTDLVIVGDDALGWMRRAQAFAGPPTDGPGS